jgi:hypothetical protein
MGIVQPAVARESHAVVKVICSGLNTGISKEKAASVLQITIDQPGKAWHKDSSGSVGTKNPIDIAQDIGLFPKEKMFDAILRKNTVNCVFNLFWPDVGQVPAQNIYVLWVQIDIDETIEYSVTAAEMQLEIITSLRSWVYLP